MAEIKFVKQEDDCGCSVACFAMLLGLTYAEVKSDFQNNFTESGLQFDKTISYLGEHGFSILHKEIKHYSQINFARKEMLKPFAPVHVVRVIERFDSEHGHLVVMTSKGKLICPGGKTDKEIRLAYEISDVLGLYK